MTGEPSPSHPLPDPEDPGLGWLDASGEHADIVLSTRVRLARNLQGHPFGPRARDEDRVAVLERVRGALGRVSALEGSEVLELTGVETRARRLLLERRLASRELVGENGNTPNRGTALVVGVNRPVSVMINEEDHLRLQTLFSGLRVHEAWNILDTVDEELGREVPYAFHTEFGFLTSCPTNVGSGLRASVLLHLPALVLTKEIGKVLQGLTQVGLTFRGLYGEGSEVVGNFFQLSNQTTLGKSEEDLIDHLDRIVRQVIQYESHARQVLLRDAASVTEDKIWRAYGLLRYARSLSFEELMNLLSGVRLGASLKLLPGLRVYPLNRIMMFTQPAHLEEAAGRELTPSESDVHRASFVRRVLASEGVSATEEGEADGPSATDSAD
jgi:protein arginine kinase